MPAAPRVTQLTSYTGAEDRPTFSPDGTHVAFVWNGERQDNNDIYVKAVDGLGPPLRLTTSPAAEYLPAWSPDGRLIAFRRTIRAPGTTPYVDVMVVPALGGPERRVASVAMPPSVAVSFASLSWTPDGRWLATPDADRAGGNGIFLVPVEQGEKRRLTANPTSADVWPALSPDGRWLAYGSCSGPFTGDIHLLRLDADHRPEGPPRRLTHEGFYLFGITWSADGRELVYAASHSRCEPPVPLAPPDRGRRATRADRPDRTGGPEPGRLAGGRTPRLLPGDLRCRRLETGRLRTAAAPSPVDEERPATGSLA